MPTGLSPDQMKVVLRRAAELERKPGEAASAVDVREIADEVGLEPEAVTRALAELHTGALEPAAEKTLLDRVIGPGTLTVDRQVPLRLPDAQRAIEAFLGQQLFRLARRTEAGSVWRADASLWSQARRALDLTGRYELPRDAVVELSLASDGDGTRVRLGLRLEAPQKRRGKSLLAYLALGGGMVAAGTTLAHTAMWDALAVAAGSGAALLGWGQVRAGQSRDLASGAEGLERLLDGLR